MMILRDYQEVGATWLASKERALLADAPGLGKTIQCIRALKDVIKDADAELKVKVLIVAPNSVQAFWKEELERELDGEETEIGVLKGTRNKAARKREWREKDSKRISIRICSYSLIRVDEEETIRFVRGWDYTSNMGGNLRTVHTRVVIFDEAHRLRNRQTATHKSAKKIAYCIGIGNRNTPEERNPIVWCLSGTPVSRGPEDLWGILHLLNRVHFPSYWGFVHTWCIVEDGVYGKEIIGLKPSHRDNFQSLIKPRMLRRSKSDVAEELPSKTRSTLRVEMTPQQRRAYKKLEKELFLSFTGEEEEAIVATSPLMLMLQLRRLIICPAFINTHLGIGGALGAIIEHIQDHGDSHVAIFCPFPHLFQTIKKILSNVYLEGGSSALTLTPLMLDGSVPADQVPIVVEKAVKEKRPLLISIKYSEGFSIPSINIGYFLGIEFDPYMNIQAEDRIHRINSPLPVNIYYTLTEETIDDDIMGILDTKYSNTAPWMESPDLRLLSQQEVYNAIKARAQQQRS